MLKIIKLALKDLEYVSSIGDNSLMISPNGNDGDIAIILSAEAIEKLSADINRFLRYQDLPPAGPDTAGIAEFVKPLPDNIRYVEILAIDGKLLDVCPVQPKLPDVYPELMQQVLIAPGYFLLVKFNREAGCLEWIIQPDPELDDEECCSKLFSKTRPCDFKKLVNWVESWGRVLRERGWL